MKLGKGKNPIKFNIRPEDYHKLVRKNRYKKPLLQLPTLKQENNIPSETYKPKPQNNPYILQRLEYLIKIYNKNNQTFLFHHKDIPNTRKAYYICEICEKLVIKDKYNPLPLACGFCIKNSIERGDLRKELEDYIMTVENDDPVSR